MKIFGIEIKGLFIVLFYLLSVLSSLSAQEENKKILSLQEFIRQAAEKDTVFQEILIDELFLKYKKALVLPADDLVFDVASQYNFLINPSESDIENSIALSKLFPASGTRIGTEYSSSISAGSREVSSSFNAYISQPIAENAFGKNTKLLDEITGIEIDVARYQIIEAYEDYFAKLIDMYYEWYSAYENLFTAQNSYNENLKLLDNIKERAKHRIALPVDVNKVELQVLLKKEQLIILESKYTQYFNKIAKAIRFEGNSVFRPESSSLYADTKVDFEKDYTAFEENSRTYHILTLLEDKSTVEVDKYADELLPSINLYGGFSVDGSGHGLSDSDKMIYTGVSLEWPFPGQVEHAQYETAKVTSSKTALTTLNTRLRLMTDLKNLYIKIEEERNLIKMAEEKIVLAQSILDDDKENYSLGKLTLNDLISEVNTLENNKFSKIYHTIQLQKLLIEWLRLTDRLIAKPVNQTESNM